MRRVLLILNFALLALVLAVWPLSYIRDGAVVCEGYGIAVDRGGFYLAGPDTLTRRGLTVELDVADGSPIESEVGATVERWKAVRHLTNPYGYSVWAFSAWFIAVVLTVPVALTWRRRRRDGRRGFEVRPAGGGDA
jgi:hypothetical protein